MSKYSIKPMKQILVSVFEHRVTGLLSKIRLRKQRNLPPSQWVNDNPKTWKLEDRKTAAGFELLLPYD